MIHGSVEACGVALLLLNTEGKIFCVKELIAKESIGKRIGDYSFPWETQEEGESDAETLKRLMREEVHGSETIQTSKPQLLGEFTVTPGTVARVYTALFVAGPEKLFGLHEGIEVTALGWQTKEVLLSHCRAGVRQALDLLERYQQVLSQEEGTLA